MRIEGRAETGQPPDIAKSGESEQLIDEVESTSDQLRNKARASLGVTGKEEIPPLRATLRQHGVGYYPLLALGVLSIVDLFQSFAFTVLTPEITAALGISVGTVAAIRSVQAIGYALSPLPMAALAQRRARRALLCILTGIGWSVVTLYTGLVTGLIGLLFVLIIDGLTTGSVGALHYPLLMDSYPPSVRVRALTFYNAFSSLGNILSPLLVGAFASLLYFTWRGVFLVLGAISVCGALYAIRLRDPGFGRWDTERLRDSVRELHGKERPTQTVPEEDVALGFFEILRRQLLIPTMRRLLAGFLVLGVFLVPFATFQSVFLDRRWGLGPGGRGVFFAFISGVSIVTLVTLGRRLEGVFRENPARVVRFAGLAVAASVITIGLGALSPIFGVMIALFALSQALVALLGPSLSVVLLSIVPARQRPHTSGITSIFAAMGGILGALFLGSVDARFGIVGSIVSLVIPGVVGAVIISSAARFVVEDMDAMIAEVVEDEEIRQITASGKRLAMLACRRVDFSYSQLQVLFGVNFTVDDGEIVALLGVNGAGKSTLLKVISGIGLPSRGSVRFRGHDITYLDAERRLRLGITQIPGGRAVFGNASVYDNLRGFGYTLGRNKKTLNTAIDRAFEAFPQLMNRRDQNASTLSGGEQQMLGLAKALILQPRLLLIDELSLGLAPVIVSQLLEMVTQINSGGTAVVLVEQSVNIALSLVEHAYFMEKGEIRFDGRAKDLLAREDLLRAVFLHGATKGAVL